MLTYLVVNSGLPRNSAARSKHILHVSCASCARGASRCQVSEVLKCDSYSDRHSRRSKRTEKAETKAASSTKVMVQHISKVCAIRLAPISVHCDKAHAASCYIHVWRQIHKLCSLIAVHTARQPGKTNLRASNQSHTRTPQHVWAAFTAHIRSGTPKRAFHRVHNKPQLRSAIAKRSGPQKRCITGQTPRSSRKVQTAFNRRANGLPSGREQGFKCGHTGPFPAPANAYLRARGRDRKSGVANILYFFFCSSDAAAGSDSAFSGFSL